jgi:dTDP-4-dehydrorhamnose reductase
MDAKVNHINAKAFSLSWMFSLQGLWQDRVKQKGGFSMKVFVTGVSGQLGHDVMCRLCECGIDAVGSDIASGGDADYVQLDITDAQAVDAVLNRVQPDGVIHCAAWTAVDAAEEEENIAKVRAINASGTKYLADACKALNCKMVYISTDYVFDGRGEIPWQPDSKDFSPLNVYGQTKLEGERAVADTLEKFFIVRTAWVFGANGNNFVKTMLQLSEKHDTLRIVCDQIGTPTYTPDLARLLVDMVQSDRYGFYHATNEGGYISWYDFACEIFRQADRHVEITPVTTEEYGISKAARPRNSRLEKSKLAQNGFALLPPWQDALRRYLKQGKECAQWDRSK